MRPSTAKRFSKVFALASIEDSLFKFFLSLFFEAPLRYRFNRCFKKFFITKDDLSLLLYDDQIITLALFLFISSSFLKEKQREEHFNFNWKSYFMNFSFGHIREFIICAIIFLFHKGHIKKNKKAIDEKYELSSKSFKDYYLKTLCAEKITDNGEEPGKEVVHKLTSYVSKVDIDFDEYVKLLDMVLKINSIYWTEIPDDCRKVLDLVDVTWEWKKKIFDMFNNKSEYIIFSFFVNLSK